MAQQFDATRMVERLPAFEDRLGVKLQGIYATIAGPDFEGEYGVKVMGELHATNGADFSRNVELCLACYDSHERVVGTASHHIFSDEFFGFETFSLDLYVGTSDIARLRLFPKPS